jgi:hypothetical protein
MGSRARIRFANRFKMHVRKYEQHRMGGATPLEVEEKLSL